MLAIKNSNMISSLVVILKKILTIKGQQTDGLTDTFFFLIEAQFAEASCQSFGKIPSYVYSRQKTRQKFSFLFLVF